MHNVHKLIKRITLMLLVMVVAFPAFALNLKEAKQQGLVGEMPSGYLGAVVSNSGTTALIKQVNGKRKQLYIKLARKNKIKVQQVAALAGEKAMKKTASGHYIKNAQGKWVKK